MFCMFIEILIAIVLGVHAGTITGLTPGIHVNLVALLLLTVSPFLLPIFGVVALACFIISLSITHTFLDVIPAIFLGAPSEETALGVLPGHRYLLQGNGIMAIKLTIIGSLFGLIMSLLLFPLLYWLVKAGYPLIKAYIPYLLMLVVAYMILRDNHKVWAFVVFAMSGVLGMLVFSFNMKDPLFPLLSGLFGVATLLYSLKDDNIVPEQKFLTHTDLSFWQTVKAVLLGNGSALLTSTLPGLSSAIAATLSVQIDKTLGDKGFMILLGTISTAGFTLSLVALAAIDKARNGAVIAITKLIEGISFVHIGVFLAVSLIVGGVAVWLTLKISKLFCWLIKKVSYQKLSLVIIGFIVVLVIALTGWKGVLILVIATAVGLIPAIVKVTRTQAMGCLMLPVIFYLL